MAMEGGVGITQSRRLRNSPNWLRKNSQRPAHHPGLWVQYQQEFIELTKCKLLCISHLLPVYSIPHCIQEVPGLAILVAVFRDFPRRKGKFVIRKLIDCAFSRYNNHKEKIYDRVKERVGDMIAKCLETYPNTFTLKQTETFVIRAIQIALAENVWKDTFLTDIRKIEAMRCGEVDWWATEK